MNKKLVWRYVTLVIVLPVLVLLSFRLQQQHITVYLAGDSTMSNKAVKAFPETGWGMPFSVFFDNSVTVKNIARNGQSTKSFIADGSWASIARNVNAGDYVLIQFGHNDEVPSKANYTTPENFSANLARFVNETREKNGNPVLITPVARRKFDANGHIVGTHEAYAALVRRVADSLRVPLIDLDKEGQALIQQLGPEDSKHLFNYLTPGENPNYPNGKTDDTHFSELGARKIAEIVLADIKALKLELAQRVVISNLQIK